jgi:hypothetical protein
MIRENCKDCGITLSQYEKEEYQELCVECHRELNNTPKIEKTTVNFRLKNKKYISLLVQN